MMENFRIALYSVVCIGNILASDRAFLQKDWISAFLALGLAIFLAMMVLYKLRKLP